MDNIDQLKSSSPSDEDQMDMMMMQLPEFSESYSDSTTAEAFPPQPEFHSTAITMRLSDSIDNPPTMQWSSFTDHQLPSNSSTAISFSNNSSSTAQLLLQRQGQATCSASLSANRLGKTSTEEGANPCGGRRENSESNNSKNKRNKSMAAMREMIFRIAAMQPINIDPESVKAPKRRNVKISKDPQSVAARHRRERISERIRILQRLVPGGTKMDTASMLDEAIHYVKFLKTHLHSLQQRAAANTNHNNNHSVVVAAADIGIGFPVPISMPTRTSAASNYHLSMPKLYQAPNLEQ